MTDLTKLVIELSNTQTSVNKRLEKACFTICDLIDEAHRVSIWRFAPDYANITCMKGFDTHCNSYFEGQVIHRKDSGPYFDALLEQGTVVACNAWENPKTKSLKEPYLAANEVKSLMDYVIQPELHPTGIICCESKFTVEIWQEEDVETLRRVANITSLFFEQL